MQPTRQVGPPLADAVRIMPYVELQTMLDAGAPVNQHNFWKSSYLASLSDKAIEVLTEDCYTMTSPLSQVHLQHLEGQVRRVGEDKTAFSHRDALCALNIVSKWVYPRNISNGLGFLKLR